MGAELPEANAWSALPSALPEAGTDPRIALRADADLSTQALAGILEKLARMDAAADRPWTHATLALIGERPAVLAARLAAAMGLETAPFKARVRRLKALGLTESLEVGYRLSPRGRTVFEALRPDGSTR